MADNIIVKDGNGANVTMRTVEEGGVHSSAIAGYEPQGGKLLVGTARERFFDNFNTFDTTDSWELVQTGTGMTVTGPLGGNAAGAGPYINIATGTTAGQQTIIRSRAMFTMPVELRYQLTASQRIANSAFRIGFLEVDDTGALITSTSITTAPTVLNARNAVMSEQSGTTATTGALIVRGAGAALDTFAAAYGTGFTTVATGTGPNFLVATTYALMLERDKINTRAFGQNVLTNTGAQFSYDRVLVNPNKVYKLYVIVETGAVAPASTTDWRLHLVNLMDATRFDVSPRAAGSGDQAKAFPVSGTVIVGSGTVTTVTTVTGVTNAGTPTAPATPYILNSAATTNGALILTGTSGLHAFYATNTGATAAFVKLYNKATAPTVGTDIPAMILPVPAATSGFPGVATLPIGNQGFRFALGLGIAITGAVDDTDTTAVAAGQVKVMLSRTI
jgi:hypothetical protein